MSLSSGRREPTRAEHYAWQDQVEREGGVEYRTVTEFPSGTKSVSYPVSEEEARHEVQTFESHDARATIRIERRRVERWEPAGTGDSQDEAPHA